MEKAMHKLKGYHRPKLYPGNMASEPWTTAGPCYLSALRKFGCKGTGLIFLSGFNPVQFYSIFTLIIRESRCQYNLPYEDVQPLHCKHEGKKYMGKTPVVVSCYTNLSRLGGL